MLRERKKVIGYAIVFGISTLLLISQSITMAFQDIELGESSTELIFSSLHQRISGQQNFRNCWQFSINLMSSIYLCCMFCYRKGFWSCVVGFFHVFVPYGTFWICIWLHEFFFHANIVSWPGLKLVDPRKI